MPSRSSSETCSAVGSAPGLRPVGQVDAAGAAVAEPGAGGRARRAVRGLVRALRAASCDAAERDAEGEPLRAVGAARRGAPPRRTRPARPRRRGRGGARACAVSHSRSTSPGRPRRGRTATGSGSVQPGHQRGHLADRVGVDAGAPELGRARRPPAPAWRATGRGRPAAGSSSYARAAASRSDREQPLVGAVLARRGARCSRACRRRPPAPTEEQPVALRSRVTGSRDHPAPAADRAHATGGLGGRGGGRPPGAPGSDRGPRRSRQEVKPPNAAATRSASRSCGLSNRQSAVMRDRVRATASDAPAGAALEVELPGARSAWPDLPAAHPLPANPPRPPPGWNICSNTQDHGVGVAQRRRGQLFREIPRMFRESPCI